MAGAVSFDDSAASTTGLVDEDSSVSADSLSEWRSCERVDNGSPSTSPPFWDTDDEDDDPGPRPSDLFGRYTWKIENFSKEKQREMKSEPFEAGGYKWYILVYPQGCDVSNHLSLFLCVTNHEKLLPGWSHFAQFTIAVGNLDPKKVKYSDTLHRFWKKEHDWGWKKFLELSKIQDGFLVDDVLEIIVQVQVIREKADYPFRCLDRPYRRELLRVYMTNIEQIYRRFVEEQRRKLIRLIDDKMRWSSFCAFWLAIEPTTRHQMSREKSNAILKIVVKHFFVEKEVASTLVMDALYTGLKALKGHSNGNKGAVKIMDLEELSAPMVHFDTEMFVLADDFIALLERAALEPLSYPPLSTKDGKCTQGRAKDGGSGEVNKISMEREERRLTELGQKILETFVLSHLFSGVEVAYQEAVALKRQEELIREEELLENEMKGKRGSAIEKDKRAKKKQAKQKKNRKVKDKEREEKSDSNFTERYQDGSANNDMKDSKQVVQLVTTVNNFKEVASDVSDVCQTDTCDEITRSVDAINDVGIETDDSTLDIETLVSSVSATVNSIRGKINNLLDSTSHISPNRGRTRRNRGFLSMITVGDEDDLPSSSSNCSDRVTFSCGPAPKRDQETALLTLKDRLRELGQRLHEKEIEGRELLKAHLEKKAGAEAAAGSSSAPSSESLDKTSLVLKIQDQPSSVTLSDANINEPSPKTLPVATNEASNGAVPAMATSTISTKSVPIFTPTTSKLEPVLCKEHPSSSTQQIGRATLMPSRLPLLDKSIPSPPKSPLSQVDTVAKGTPAPPKSPLPQVTINKSTPAPKASTSQLDKGGKAIPRPLKSPASHVDKVSPHNSLPQQRASTSINKAQEGTVLETVAVTSVPRTPTPTSRPTSTMFLTPRSTVPPAPSIQVSPSLSCSMTLPGQQSDGPPPSTPIYVTQAYRNAILGKCSLDSTSASVKPSTSIGQNVAVSQPLSAYASATSVSVPPIERNEPGKQGFMFGFNKSETLDNCHPWNGSSDVNRPMWREDTRNQQLTDCNAHVPPWKDYIYTQMSSSRAEQGICDGQYRQLQREIPASLVSYQQSGPVGEEFPHLDIINDLLDEEQNSASMIASPLHNSHTSGLPFFSECNMTDSETTSVSTGQFNLTDHYYNEGYLGAYNTQNALHRLKDGQRSTLDVYSNGSLNSIASKPWLYNQPNPAANLGMNSNVFSQQTWDYINLASGRVNGEYQSRGANGQR